MKEPVKSYTKNNQAKKFHFLQYNSFCATNFNLNNWIILFKLVIMWSDHGNFPVKLIALNKY